MIIDNYTPSPWRVFKHPSLLLNSFYWWDLKYQIGAWFKPRQKWLTKTIPNTWCDKTSLIPHLLFTCLVNYVEDENGLQDACEPPFTNINVALYDAEGNILATTQTDGDGEFYFNEFTPNFEGIMPNTTYIVVVGTVGVGQWESTVSKMTGMFLLLLLPGGGDELQGIKRGIVELADLILVNKADGTMQLAAERSATDYRNALMFMHPRTPNWEVPVEICSSLNGEQMAHIWELICRFRNNGEASGIIARARADQAGNWMWNEVSNGLTERLKAHPAVAARATELEQAVRANQVSPTSAADELMDIFVGK